MRGVLLFLVVALFLAGCRTGSKKPDPAPSGTGVGSSTLPGASTGPAAPDKPVSSAIGDIPGSRVDVFGLKRVADAMRLEFGVTAGSDSVPFIVEMGDPGLGRNTAVKNVSGVALVDGKNAKEYRVLLGADERSCRCSGDLIFLRDDSVRLFAEFSLPPPDVATFQVIVPHFAPMLDVAVEGSGARSRTPQSLTPKPVATVAGSGEESDVDLDVYDLERSEGFMVLRFGLHNRRSDSYSPRNRFQAQEEYDPRRDDLSGVTLLDEAAQQKYLPLTDATGYCLCSRYLGTGLRAGVTQVYWVAFPASPAATTSVQVGMPSFGPVNVPVTGQRP